MKKFITDILRDKNSTKYSITKAIAVLMTIVLVVYIGLTSYRGGEFDQFLIGQMIVMILTLTGFKNNFGVSKLQPKPPVKKEIVLNTESSKDEGDF